MLYFKDIFSKEERSSTFPPKLLFKVILQKRYSLIYQKPYSNFKFRNKILKKKIEARMFKESIIDFDGTGKKKKSRKAQ